MMVLIGQRLMIILKILLLFMILGAVQVLMFLLLVPISLTFYYTITIMLVIHGQQQVREFHFFQK